MSRYHHPDLVALDEIEDLLEAYAESRLTPSSPVLARMRRAVVAEAASVGATRAAAERGRETSAERRARLAWFPRIRVPAAAVATIAAAVMGLGMGTAVLAAPPGSPFYGARVALEQAFLPTQVDDRLASHEQHLKERLAEAELAAARGDGPALAAALAAYDAEVAQALGDLGADVDRLAHLEAMLAKHVDVLTALQAEVPEQASVDKALENSQKAIANIRDKKQGGGGGGGGGGNGGGGGGGRPNDGPRPPPDRGPQE